MRAWVFTLNNPTAADRQQVQALEDPADYLIWAVETTPQTGTVHIQGYAYFGIRITLHALQQLIPAPTGQLPWDQPSKTTPLQG